MFPNQAEIQREHLNGLFIHNYQPSKAKFLTQKDCPILRNCGLWCLWFPNLYPASSWFTAV